MKIIFAGTSFTALPTLRTLNEQHEVTAVITRLDAPTGRRKVLTSSPVATIAQELSLDTWKSNRLDGQITERVALQRPDIGVVVAYGGLIREPLLSLPKYGWINLHFSLLPQWRGAAPVQRALLAQDTQMGVSVFSLVDELDAGALYASRAYEIDSDATAFDVLEYFAECGADLVAEVLGDIANGTAVAVPQSGEPTYAHKMKTEDGELDFLEDALRVYARFRAVTQEPGAYGWIGAKRCKIHACALAEGELVAPLRPGELACVGKKVFVGTGTDPIELIEVQPDGKKRMYALDWWRGVSGNVVFDVRASSI